MTKPGWNDMLFLVAVLFVSIGTFMLAGHLFDIHCNMFWFFAVLASGLLLMRALILPAELLAKLLELD